MWQQQAERAEPPRSSGGRLSAWLRRLGGSATRKQVHLDTLRRLDEVCAVLERARDVVADGWVQDRGYEPSGRATSEPITLFGAKRIKAEDVAGACLVGAVALAARERDARADLTVDAGPTIDFAWYALQKYRGLGDGGVSCRAVPPGLRLARIRDLMRWNDQPGRTRDEVLAVLDLGVSLAIMTAMREPAPTAAGRQSTSG
jgi:hypothetical protein